MLRVGGGVCREGEEGDNFYVIESGQYRAYTMGPDGSEQVLFKYDSKGAYGELALMYNCPRAATVVVSSTACLSTMRRGAWLSHQGRCHRNVYVLHSYNVVPMDNWMSRCFTLQHADVPMRIASSLQGLGQPARVSSRAAAICVQCPAAVCC